MRISPCLFLLRGYPLLLELAVAEKHKRSQIGWNDAVDWAAAAYHDQETIDWRSLNQHLSKHQPSVSSASPSSSVGQWRSYYSIPKYRQMEKNGEPMTDRQQEQLERIRQYDRDRKRARYNAIQQGSTPPTSKHDWLTYYAKQSHERLLIPQEQQHYATLNNEKKARAKAYRDRKRTQ